MRADPAQLFRHHQSLKDSGTLEQFDRARPTLSASGLLHTVASFFLWSLGGPKLLRSSRHKIRRVIRVWSEASRDFRVSEDWQSRGLEMDYNLLEVSGVVVRCGSRSCSVSDLLNQGKPATP